MARVLCVWEIGSSLGHLANLQPFIKIALELGHEVSLATRERENVAVVLGTSNIRVYQAPFNDIGANPAGIHPLGYAEYLLQSAFPSAEILQANLLEWEKIFASARPDLVIHEHSPTALIAGLGRDWKKWIVGSGFANPRTDGPYLGIFGGVKKSTENDGRLEKSERTLVEWVNRSLHAQGRQPIVKPAEIYTQCEHQILLTVPELDHFGYRRDANYLGPLPLEPGAAFQWPPGDGPKVFAYLRTFPKLRGLLDLLLKERARVVLYARGLSPLLRKQFAPYMEFSEKPADLSQAFAEADYVISHGNAATATQAYMAGLPQLLIPRHFEQLHFSKRLAAAKAGVIAFTDQPDYQLAWRSLQQLKLKKSGYSISELLNSGQFEHRVRGLFAQSSLK